MFENLQLEGEVHVDKLHRTIYSTDASAYEEEPMGVVYPKHAEDVRRVVAYAAANGLTLIPRTAGTSLAGQVVGDGLVLDLSKYLNKILEINPTERWVRVEPGVVLDELNLACKPYGLFFAPETSTSNRCQLGGMVGNNSCGSHSLVYGSTREHLLEAKVVLSDGSEAHLKAMSREEVSQKLQEETLEGRIYQEMVELLTQNADEILAAYPDKTLTRRNTGYALDELLFTRYFDKDGKVDFNLCKLLAGSEGTLAIATELKLNLEPLPPAYKALIALHCKSLEESFEANLVALEHGPVAIELIDGKILELSKQNIAQNKNRFFIEGDPKAVLIIELAEATEDALHEKAATIIAALKEKGMGYHYPVIYGGDIAKVWELRKAGLGLLSGMVGDAKPVSVVEDTAVAPHRLPAYLADFKAMMDGYGLDCVYHAHIATGELHLRPILNLKDPKDKKLFRLVARDCALLVKKHRGSLSGEHGDGRLRGEFIPLLFGEKVYQLMKRTKAVWDEKGVFNKGKIVDTPPMDAFLRYKEHQGGLHTHFDYAKQGGYLRAIEQCNGSGDCRKSEQFAGVMCPTFRARKEEKYATRARANLLRGAILANDYANPEVLEVLDNCVSCKGCKSECPSNVDMTRYKAEYMQRYYDKRRVPLRTFLVANISKIHDLFSFVPWAYNMVVKSKCLSSLLKKVIGFAQQRSLPTLGKKTLRRWYKKNYVAPAAAKGKLYIFADEFTNHMDVEVGVTFVKLLTALGYAVEIPKHGHSGRAELSKGLLKQAKKRAQRNVELLHGLVTEEVPLVGIEPSTLLSFRDEYPDLVGSELREKAVELAKHTLLYDEFIVREIQKGNIRAEQFTDEPMKIKLHGHCHQKSLASVEPSKEMLSLPRNYTVDLIPAGCCGMAGSFGYEEEHYELSMAIGETSLFPAVRQAAEYVISAPGTSCREQIAHGTGREALHPVEVMWGALRT